MRTSTTLMAGAVLLALAACKETTRIESKGAAPAAAAPADKGPGVEVRTGNDTVKVDSTGVSATIHKDS